MTHYVSDVLVMATMKIMAYFQSYCSADITNVYQQQEQKPTQKINPMMAIAMAYYVLTLMLF